MCLLAAVSVLGMGCSDGSDSDVRDAGIGMTDAGRMTDAGHMAEAGPPDAAVSQDDQATTTRNVTVEMDVTANDVPREVVSTITAPAHGAAELTADGQIDYAPDGTFSGTDSFTYTAGTATHTVMVNVLPELGTVSGGLLYRVVQSANRPTATVSQVDRGFFWIDANDSGEAIGDYGEEDGSGMFLRTADRTFISIPPPADAPTGGFGDIGLSGLDNAGRVTGWYFNGDYTVAGTFVWSQATGSVNQTGSETNDLIANTIDDSGRVVGYTEDYDSANWRGFVVEAGGSFATPRFVSVPDYAHAMLFEVDAAGVALGTVTRSTIDGWDHGVPKTCFTLDLDTPAAIPVVWERPADVFYVDCRGLNAAGLAVGHFFPGDMASHWTVHYAMSWGQTQGWHRVDFPQPNPVGVAERREELLAVTESGRLFGNVLYDTFGDQQILPLELDPVDALPSTSYGDTPFDHVGALWRLAHP